MRRGAHGGAAITKEGTEPAITQLGGRLCQSGGSGASTFNSHYEPGGCPTLSGPPSIHTCRLFPRTWACRGSAPTPCRSLRHSSQGPQCSRSHKPPRNEMWQTSGMKTPPFRKRHWLAAVAVQPTSHSSSLLQLLVKDVPCKEYASQTIP